MSIAILGAGLAGIELGRIFKNSGRDFFILEKESATGGLCRTNRTGEYYWDFAVHALYSRRKEVMDYFLSLPLDYEHLERNAKIFHAGQQGKTYMLTYPFESGVRNLPFKHRFECVYGYLMARVKKRKGATNLKEWIETSLGPGIAKHFMVPYNEKIWNCELSKISEKLVQSKIDPPSFADFIASLFGRETPGRAYQAAFVYPKHGIQRLPDYLARDFAGQIVLNAEVTGIEKNTCGWTIVTKDGVKRTADRVVSTIPLVQLLPMIDVGGVEKQYDVFKWNNTFFVMVGLKQGCVFRLVEDCHWVFFKGDEIFYRITLMHNFSGEFPPVLVAEVTQKGALLGKTKEEIQGLVIRDLQRTGVLGSPDEIGRTDITLVDFTYPIPTVGLDGVRDRIRSALANQGLYLLGRNGSWDYINMDGVVLKARECAAECFGIPCADTRSTKT